MCNKYILLISAVYPPEPVVSSHLSENLYYALKDKGLEVRVLHPKPTRPNGFRFDAVLYSGEDEIITDSYTCPQSSIFGRVRESYSFGKACTKYIREHYKEITLIYANAWPMLSQHMIVKTTMRYGIPVVIHVQDVYPESMTNKLPIWTGKLLEEITLPYDRETLKNSRVVVVISDKMKDYLVCSRGLKPENVEVVVNWQDETEFLEYQKNSKVEIHDNFTYMYLGNIGPVAGVDLLIDAYVNADIPNSKLVIAGSGSMKKKLIDRVWAFHNIEFLDVPNGKVPEIQSRADCMLLPIKKGAASSSIPSKLPAYMFSAKPIIGCVDEDSDTANAIKDAGCGWVIEPDNIEKLTETMKMVVSLDKEYLENKAKKALLYGLSHFSKGKNLSKLVDIIIEQINS